LTFGDSPYPDRKTYVFTSNPTKFYHPQACFINTPPKTLIQSFPESAVKDIWLVGGGSLIAGFLGDNLIDEFIISIHPIILGNGIPLFPKQELSQRLKLKETKTFDSGLVQVNYEKV